jgi:hypothetical protein
MPPRRTDRILPAYPKKNQQIRRSIEKVNAPLAE